MGQTLAPEALFPVERTQQSRLTQVDWNNLPFGKVFSDHMLVADYRGNQWQDVRIVPYGNLSMSPAISAIHYGQTVFEGMKAFRDHEGQAVLFRVSDHFKRLNASADRLAMPALPRDIFEQGLRQLLTLDNAWLGPEAGSQLYIRPFMYATDGFLGVRPSDTYSFVIFTSPVKSYYASPLKVYVEDEDVRAVRGGVGSVKTAGNYARTMAAGRRASERGFNVVLWLDGLHRRYLNEFSTMNVFVVIGNQVLTPPTTSGTILEGVTRDSILTLLRETELEVVERDIDINELTEAARNGSLREVFGAGTAAVVSPVQLFEFRGETYQLPPVEGFEVANRVKERLQRLRTRQDADPYGWVELVS